MSNNQRFVWYVALLVAGILLVGLGMLEQVDGYVAGIGGALAAMAVVRLVLERRYATDPAYARKVDVSNSDERLAFLAGKSAEWAFKLSVIGLAVLSLVLRPFGYDETANTLSFIMAIELIMYWAGYFVLSRRY